MSGYEKNKFTLYLSKTTYMSKGQNTPDDVMIFETKKFLHAISHSSTIEKFQLRERETDFLKLRWTYGFSNKQLAEKYAISEGRIRQIMDIAHTKLFTRLHKMIEGTFYNNESTAHLLQPLKQEIERLKTEKIDLKIKNEKLKQENEEYKERFKQLSSSEQLKFRELDLLQKGLRETDLPKDVTDLLYYKANIKEVGELMNFKAQSLLFIDGMDVKKYETIMNFVRKNRLKMRS